MTTSIFGSCDPTEPDTNGNEELEVDGMLNVFKVGLRTSAIIGLLMGVLLLGGCSSIKLGYTNAPSLVTWWLDGYLDLDATQSTRMRADLLTLLDWHRKEEMPQLAAMLQDMQKTSVADLTPDDACRLSNAVEARVFSLTERALPLAAGAAVTLTAPQIDHLQAAFDKRNVEWREQWLDGAPADRAQTRLKKLVERTESFYGRVSEAQTSLLKQQIAASSFDAEMQYREIQRRQQDALQVLRNLTVKGTTAAQSQTALQALLTRSRQSPDAAYAEYNARSRLAGCASIARFHASTSPAQRARLQQTLKDYEAAVRTLIPATPPQSR